MNLRAGRLTEVSFDPDFLYLKFADGYAGKLKLLPLRRRCPCASCRGGDFGLVGANTRNIHKASLDTIHFTGNYAINPVWADGHNTGIHTFVSLRAEAEAEASGMDESGLIELANRSRGYVK